MKEKTKVYYAKTWELKSKLYQIIRDLGRSEYSDEIITDLRNDIDYLKNVESELFDNDAIVKSGHIICIDKLENKIDNFDIKHEIVKELYLKISTTILTRLNLVTKVVYLNESIIIETYTYLKSSTNTLFHKPDKLVNSYSVSHTDLTRDYRQISIDIVGD